MFAEMIAAENRHDVDGSRAAWAHDMQGYMNGVLSSSSREDDHLALAAMFQVFAGYHVEVQWVDASSDRLAYQWVLRGRHVGEWAGFPGTGNPIEFHGCTIDEHDGSALKVRRTHFDQGEMVRQLSGKVRAPGTASAAPSQPPIPEGERARYEAAGQRLIRTVYEAENERDIEKQLACYADPLLDHFVGRVNALPLSRARRILPPWWESVPGLLREIEEVLAFGNRAVLRWHMTADEIDGKPVDQHGCSVIEHDGERITKFWAYYPDLAQVFPAVLQLE
jgi:predicted ester cyclase